MTHAEMDELYELYALGTLENEAANEIDAHLRDECAYCLEHVQQALQVTSGLAALAEPVTPPKELRERIVGRVKSPARQRSWIFAVAALSAACLGLLLFSIWSTSQVNRMREQLGLVSGERDQLRSAIALLTRSDTRTVQFGRAEDPHGRVLVNRTGGVVFVGSQLPALSPDKTFELWLVPANGAPQPAGLFRPNTSGESVHVSPRPVTAATAAVAVSIEPRQGSSAPTTKPIVVVPLG